MRKNRKSKSNKKPVKSKSNILSARNIDSSCNSCGVENNNGLFKNYIKSSTRDLCEVVNSLTKSLDNRDQHFRYCNSNERDNENSENTADSRHTLFHYSRNKGIERVQFDKDKCPVCNFLIVQNSCLDNKNDDDDDDDDDDEKGSKNDKKFNNRDSPIFVSSDSSSTLSSYSSSSSVSVPPKLVNVNNNRLRFRSASDISETFIKDDTERIGYSPPNSAKSALSFTFEFSTLTDDPPTSTGVSVDLTNCRNVSFQIQRLSHESTLKNHHNTRQQQHAHRRQQEPEYQINAPPARNWLNIQKPIGGLTFTLMCYNVLCQKYATTTMYPYCPSFALDWEYRKRGILEEIWKYSADIICLQELETSQYETVFSVELKQRKYEGHFLPKSRSRTMGESDSKCVDGCAIFWKIDSFEKVKHFTHEFMLSCFSVSKNPAPELLNRVMNRDNVALSLILEAKDPKMNRKQICVSTGHIHWDPEFSDVKLIQSLFWTSELWNYIREYYQSMNNTSLSPTDMPVIFCGDFNSLPNSGVIDYLMKGEVHRSHVDFRDFGDKYMFDEWTAIQEEFVENDLLKHHFNFDRAYKTETDSGLKWTNYTYDFRGVIDYIFFTKDNMRLLGSLQQIPEDWFDSQKIVGAPHVHLNSDHFSLFVELELLTTAQQQQQHNMAINSNNNNANNNSGVVGSGISGVGGVGSGVGGNSSNSSSSLISSIGQRSHQYRSSTAAAAATGTAVTPSSTSALTTVVPVSSSTLLIGSTTTANSSSIVTQRGQHELLN